MSIVRAAGTYLDEEAHPTSKQGPAHVGLLSELGEQHPLPSLKLTESQQQKTPSSDWIVSMSDEHTRG